MNLDEQLKLQAYLDGQLPPDEAREVSLLIQRDPAAARVLAQLRDLRQAVRSAQTPAVVAESREFYWSKIARDIERLERRSLARPQPGPFARLRFLVLPTAAIAVLIIVGMALNFGVTPPPAAPVKTATAQATKVEPKLATTDATTYRDEQEGTTLVWFSDKLPSAPVPPPKPIAPN